MMTVGGGRERIRILYITSRADYGGGPEHLYRLIKGLPSSFEVWVACPDDHPYHEKYLSLPMVKGVLTIAHRAFRLSDLWRVFSLIKRQDVQCLHSHGKGAGLLGRPVALLTGIPCVHTFHGIHMGQYGACTSFLYKFYERLMGAMTAIGIAVSVGERRALMELGFISSDRLALVNNGVMLPVEMATAPAVGQRLDVVTISRFDYQKNTGAIISVMEQLDSWGKLDLFRFVFVGDGEYRDEIETTVFDRWGADTCLFTGYSTNPSEYLKNAFCYLSTSRWEGLPLAVLEAMSFGVPALVSNVIGNRDAVENSGFLFDLDDHKSTARDLCDLAKSRDLWWTLSQACRHRVEQHFSMQAMVGKTVKIYESL